MPHSQVLQTNMLKKFNRKAISFLRQPSFTKRWLPVLWILLGLSRMAILLFSFRRLAPHLGHPRGIASYTPLLTPEQEAKAAQVGQSIRLAARYTPWVANCFPQAVTARLILGLYGIPYSLFFGVMRDPDTHEHKAHAWVTTGRVAVTGGHSFGLFTVVGCYSSQPPPPRS